MPNIDEPELFGGAHGHKMSPMMTPATKSSLWSDIMLPFVTRNAMLESNGVQVSCLVCHESPFSSA